jgi:hypothetical protein
MWDGDEVLDVTSGQRGSLAGSLTSGMINMTYRFDRAIGVRSRDVHWAVAYTNRSTKAVLMKNGLIHRELNRSFYCADAYDYPITIGADAAGRVVVVHCPNKFDLLEIEDAETGTVLDSLESEQMEFHSRLKLSADGLLLIDAGWFWHPWCGAVVFEITQADDGALRFTKNTRFPQISQHRMKSTAWRFWETLISLSEVSARSNSAFGRWPNADGNRRLT